MLLNFLNENVWAAYHTLVVGGFNLIYMLLIHWIYEAFIFGIHKFKTFHLDFFSSVTKKEEIKFNFTLALLIIKFSKCNRKMEFLLHFANLIILECLKKICDTKTWLPYSYIINDIHFLRFLFTCYLTCFSFWSTQRKCYSIFLTSIHI